MINLKIKYINWWNRSLNNIQDNWLLNFITNILKDKYDDINIIEINNDNIPDIILCSCFGNINNVNNVRYKNVIKIFFYGENLKRFQSYNNFIKLESIFDLIIGFGDTNLNKKHLHLPLWIKYYNYYNMNNIDNNILTYINKSFNDNLPLNNGKCALIARHDRNGIRTKLKKNIESNNIIVDCPGILHNNIEKIGFTNDDKINFLKKYKYNICPENSKGINYFTEKIFQSFECGCIPIYWAITKPEIKILNPDYYIFLNNDKNEKSFNSKKIKTQIDKINNLLLKKEDKHNIFTESAFNELQNIYTNLENEILRLINLKNITCFPHKNKNKKNI